MSENIVVNEDLVENIADEFEIPNSVKTILDTFEKKGFSAFIVGGAVRSFLTGRDIHDWDVATSALPSEIKETFSAYKTIDVGIRHGTVAVVVDDMKIECTTYRIDGAYSDNRKPDTVEYTDDIVKDLERRDFTMNAIAYSPWHGLVDPFGGVDDIADGIIRCVGDPSKRFEEDGLRIIRCIRFAAQLGFDVEDNTDKAIKCNVDLLDNISKERIRDELVKILSCEYCANSILEKYVDVVCKIIPDMKKLVEYEQKEHTQYFNMWNHTLHCMNYFVCMVDEEEHDDIITRLAILLHDIGKPSCKPNATRMEKATESAKITNKILKDLKFSNEITAYTTQLISYMGVEFGNVLNIKYLAKTILGRLGEEQTGRLLFLERANHITGVRLPLNRNAAIRAIEAFQYCVDEAVENDECCTLKQLAVDGDDLINIGIPEGAMVGYVLDVLLEKVINEDIPNEKDTLLHVARFVYNG